MSKTYHTWIVWGSKQTIAENGDNSISRYEFETEAELKAFMDGVDCASGWNDFNVFRSIYHAKAYVREATNSKS